MKLTIADDLLKDCASALRDAVPQTGETASRRQPVHTVYGGAHLFRPDVAQKLGRIAQKAFLTYGPDFATFARALQMPGFEQIPEDAETIADLWNDYQQHPRRLQQSNPAAHLAARVWQRVQQKLEHQPVEDFRIDFEDGYGHRSDEEEDTHAVCAATALAQGMKQATLPPFVGVRIKALTEELFARAARTLDIFLTTLIEKAGALPPEFVVTLPKTSAPAQILTLTRLLFELEQKLGLQANAIKIEIMVETANALISRAGIIALPQLVAAARGRCRSVHLGPYDFTSSCGIIASAQDLRHPSCDFARLLMQVTMAGTGVNVVDGPTNVLPIEPHRADGTLSDEQKKENRQAVHRAWRLSFANISAAFHNGFYQGWDLHPAQLPARYAACFCFFLEHLEESSTRLAIFMDAAARASLSGTKFDDAATGQGLLNHFTRALSCGAITSEDLAGCGLTQAELQTNSFLAILKMRKAL